MADEDFSPDDKDILAEFGIPLEEQATTTTDAPAAQPDQVASEQPKPEPTEAPNVTQQVAPEPAAAPQPGGDTRAALRASRRAEQRAREEAARLRAELEALKAAVPAQQEDDPMSDEEIERAERDFPLLGKTARLVKEAAKRQATAPVQQAPATGEFIPPTLPPQVQDIVDASPELLAWQLDPDQSRFTLAKTIDGLLEGDQHWSNKPVAERFQEVVRRVTAAMGTAPVSAPPVNTAAVLAAVPRRTPETLSHIGGGGGVNNPTPTADRYMQMSEEQIIADLLLGD